MLTSRLSVEGQTTVPIEIRKALKVGPGTVLEWHLNGSKASVVPLASAKAQQPEPYDYEAHIRRLKASPAVPDHLLNIKRSKGL